MQAEEHFRRRVSAVAYEIAARLGFSEEDRESVRGLALHGPPAALHDGDWLGRLEREIDQDSSALGAALVRGGHAEDRYSPVLDVATAFVEGLDYSPYEDRPARVILSELRELASEGYLDRAALAALEALRLPPALSSSLQRLRVYPAVLMRVLALANDQNASLMQIETLAQSDQALAAGLLRAANSAAYSPGAPVTTISRAIALIGMDQGKKVLIAAGAQALFASASLSRLWTHSLETAAAMEYLASLSGAVAVEEAFVAGLIHDIGRLAIESMPAEYGAAHRRVALECPVLADMVVAGEDHGSLGAALLRQWGLPESLARAVECHHRPEADAGGLAGLLYLAEFVTDAEEDAPSISRLRAALKSTGIRWTHGLADDLMIGHPVDSSLMPL
jgi:putative nucleotidyltransferase with HDIG domain